MTCRITSDVATSPTTAYTVPTDVDQSKNDAENIDVHIRNVTTSPGIDGGTSITTTWPGIGSACTTVRNDRETVTDWLARHKSLLLSKAAADPIDCP